MELNKIMQGDVLEKLKEIPDESVDCVITSPPYFGLRDYGVEGQIGLEKTLDEYLDKMLAVTKELKRVLKKTGTMFWNHGDSYGGSGNGSWNAPIEIRGKQYRKTCNIDQEYLGPPRKDKTLIVKCLMLQNYRLAIRMIDEQKWILRNILIWHKPNCMPSSVKDRFTVDYEPVFFFTKSRQYWFEQQFESYAPASDVRYTQALRSNKEYNVKAPYRSNTPYAGYKKGQGTVAHRDNVAPQNHLLVGGDGQGRTKRCVWKIPTQPFSEAHFATFPEDLIMPMVKAGCPEGGIVLDPFGGAMTTCVVAKKLRRNFIAIELNPVYIEIGKRRLFFPEPML